MSKKTDQDFHEDLAVEEARPQLKRPPLYKVILLNDDYTPMDFVIHILDETKVAQVNDSSRENQHPLKCTMEEA